MVSVINGIIWRDRNGDGIAQENEEKLTGKVFWDKNNDGEHNSSIEPSLETNEKGEFAFEWISSIYPTYLNIDSELLEGINQTKSSFYRFSQLHRLHKSQLKLKTLNLVLKKLEQPPYHCLTDQHRLSKGRYGLTQMAMQSTAIWKVVFLKPNFWM